MKQLVNIANQVFEMERKLGDGESSLHRHLHRIKSELADLGFSYHSPLNEAWDETRTDCEASITGALRGRMRISEVVKPVVYQQADGTRKVVQKAIVVVA